MIQISVTRGLVQLKRLEEKIQRDIRMISEFVTVNKVQEKNVLNGTMILWLVYYEKTDWQERIIAFDRIISNCDYSRKTRQQLSPEKE